MQLLDVKTSKLERVVIDEEFSALVQPLDPKELAQLEGEHPARRHSGAAVNLDGGRHHTYLAGRAQPARPMSWQLKIDRIIVDKSAAACHSSITTAAGRRRNNERIRDFQTSREKWLSTEKLGY